MNRLFSIAIFLFLLSVVCFAGENKKTDKKPKKQTQQQAVPQPEQPRTPSPTSPYWTGDGGKGMSLAIISPKGSGLTTALNYIPDLVQGEFVSNFSNYSAISVLDRISLDKVIAETLDPTYKDNLDIVRLGHIAQTDYIMTGTVTKTSSGYALQIQITSTIDGMTKASYSGTCTVAELDNFIGIRRASLELLPQMGVILKEDTKDKLSNAGQENYVNAQTTLAQGIVAQRNGNTIESLAKFYQANSYDPSFAEAATRVNTLSATIRTGNYIENIRNDLAWRNEWKKLIEEGKEWFKKQPRPEYARLIYDPELSYSVNYKNDTMVFQYNALIERLPKPDYHIKVREDLAAGLRATKRNSDWGLEVGYYYWELHSPLYIYTADLYNDKGKKVKSHCFILNKTPIRGTLQNNFSIVTNLEDDVNYLHGTSSKIGLPGLNDNLLWHSDEIPWDSKYYIEIFSRSSGGTKLNNESYWLKGQFEGVKIDDVTDTMTIKITNIYEFKTEYRNGVDYETTTLTLLRQGTNIIRVNTEKLSYPGLRSTFSCQSF